jgi:hypothetical protein
MRKVLLGGLLVVAFVVASPASAGCWATVGLAPPPSATGAGDVWMAELTVLQHGANPLPDAATAVPKVTIVNAASGERRTFRAKASDAAAGTYVAQVVFPSQGKWRYEVFDGFTSADGEPAPCAQTHTFGAVEIGAGSGGKAGPTAPAAAESGAFPVWSVGAGAGGLLVVAVAFAYFLRRRTHRAPAAA